MKLNEQRSLGGNINLRTSKSNVYKLYNLNVYNSFLQTKLFSFCSNNIYHRPFWTHLQEIKCLLVGRIFVISPCFLFWSRHK